jgi:hypothetical protein
MKKIMLAATLLLGVITSSFAAEPNKKVLDAFQRTFTVNKVSWLTMGELHEACFDQNSVRVRVLYDKEGNLLQSIRYYDGKTLPILLQEKIARQYQGKTIFGVTEVNSGDQTVYNIVLEDEREFLHVSSDNSGQMHMDKRFNKAE